MLPVVFLKKGSENPLPFQLIQYQEPEGGFLHGPTTLTELKLATLKAKLPGYDFYVPIAFNATPEQLSLERFKANTEETALPVTGEGEMLRQSVHCLNLSTR
jgi:hypothetical protein